MMGKNPDTDNVMSGHSDKLTNAFYREMLAVFQDRETYAYYDVFPEIHIAEVSAKNETINLNRQKRFASLTCRSVGGTLTGAVEIGEDGLLYCDDLVEDLEESLNPQRLEAKYNAYLNQLKDRKKDGARELMVGTRWNVLDPIGRIQEQYKNSPLYKFLVIPAVDELGQSNFMYDYGVGFSTEYYTDMKNSIDDATWNAKYMGAPYVREGLLFPADGLKYYDGTLPDGEPDKILAACDVAWGGGDSLSMPVCYIYGQDAYIADVVFNRGNKDITRPIVIGKLKKHRPHQVEFEANNGGDEYAGIVSDHLKKENVIINITSRKAPTKTSKLERIVQVAPEIKSLFFLQEQYRDGEYRAFMQELTTFVISGVNPHDDAPDSLSMLVNMIFYGIATVEPVARPF